jgi:hypothetical protein
MTDSERPQVSGSMRVDSDSVVVEIPTQSVPMVFPVTTASIDGVVHSVMIAEYGPLSGVSPDGHILRTAVLERWPDARVFERRSTGERGARLREFLRRIGAERLPDRHRPRRGVRALRPLTGRERGLPIRLQRNSSCHGDCAVTVDIETGRSHE